jgi:hypothetical protein
LELDLRPLEMSFQSESFFLVSSWVAFHGCSLELTNGGCQCWVLMVTRLSSTNKCDRKTMSTIIRHVVIGTEFLANQFIPPGKEPVQVY